MKMENQTEFLKVEL